MQGVTQRCFFGYKCVVNTDTRNRCKPCRFNRCLEQGMSMDSVKLGRIPKSVKMNALRECRKSQDEEMQEITILSDDDRDKSSSSPTNSYNANTTESNDESPEIIVISPGK
jgi:hypothetical protein